LVFGYYCSVGRLVGELFNYDLELSGVAVTILHLQEQERQNNNSLQESVNSAALQVQLLLRYC
jgi:hypothetical protein